MWIELRGRQHRVYWRTGLEHPKKAYEAFATREDAQLFIDTVRYTGDREQVRDLFQDAPRRRPR